MNSNELIPFLQSPNTQEHFSRLYGKENTAAQTERYTNLVHTFTRHFGTGDIRLFSSPGRCELGGNHTDHNLGKVLATSIQLDCVAAVRQTDDGTITVHDITFNEDFTVAVNECERVTGEAGSIALVRGIVNGFLQNGYAVTGFKAVITSSVIPSSGVSSSAAFEMLLCLILNELCNGGVLSVHNMARIAQRAENVYWDKKSGLLDQMAAASGGMVHIDFANAERPVVTKINFDFAKENCALILVNTGKNHADLSAEYSSIPLEMKSVAAACNGSTALRPIQSTQLLQNIPRLREACGDRAVLRALHFMSENERVDAETAALQNGDFDTFLRLVTESGLSSALHLQNMYCVTNPREQSIPLCLALTELFIKSHIPHAAQKRCAYRVHGGGFAGVIMVLLPREYTNKYRDFMHKMLNFDTTGGGAKDPVYVMSIRDEGAIEITGGE